MCANVSRQKQHIKTLRQKYHSLQKETTAICVQKNQVFDALGPGRPSAEGPRMDFSKKLSRNWKKLGQQVFIFLDTLWPIFSYLSTLSLTCFVLQRLQASGALSDSSGLCLASNRVCRFPHFMEAWARPVVQVVQKSCLPINQSIQVNPA